MEIGIDGAGFERINVGCPRSILEKCLDRMAGVLEGNKTHSKIF